VSQLPFPDQMFDLATAVETHYYWPDLNADMQEVLRVLKPGGALIVIAEAYKGGKYDRLLQNLERLRGMMNYAHLTVSEHSDLLSKAGYSDVQLFEEYDKGWLCAVGRKGELDASGDFGSAALGSQKQRPANSSLQRTRGRSSLGVRAEAQRPIRTGPASVFWQSSCESYLQEVIT